MNAVAALLITSALATDAAAATGQRAIAIVPRVPDALIVGRAYCAGTAWLLTEAADLVSVAGDPPKVRLQHVAGLRPDDQPWGLACVNGPVFWTLPSPRALARLTTDGRLVERINLGLPRIALFGVADRLLFQQLPPRAGTPILQSSRPGRSDVQSWAGLSGRVATTPEARLQLNLVNCGIGLGRLVPCWFADQARVAISDGIDPRVVTIAALREPSINPGTPIGDVALVQDRLMWILAVTTMAGKGQPAGERLLRADSRGSEIDHIDLAMPARLILSADASRCVLLAIDGTLIEVSAR